MTSSSDQKEPVVERSPGEEPDDPTVSARDKESWPKIAQSWLDMLPKGTYSAEDEFNKTVRDVALDRKTLDQ